MKIVPPAKTNLMQRLQPDAPTTEYVVNRAAGLEGLTLQNPAKLAGQTANPYSKELADLLRNRLNLASLILLLALMLFWVRNVLIGPTGATEAEGSYFHGALMLLIAILAGVLVSPLNLSIPVLRAIELTIFGTMTLHFAWLHLNGFYRDYAAGLAAYGHEADVMRLAGNADILRWFSLIVVYGTFIPNTWRRCALVVSLIALTPLAITGGWALCDPGNRFALLNVLSDQTIVMAIGAAVAVFGSYKIHILHAEAAAARELGQYRLKERLGSGGMGEVYLAEHVLLRRPCAVKVVRPEQAGDPASLLRFEREVRAMATLTHWNSIEIYDYGHAADGTFYYAMEYLPGLTLQELIDRHGPLPPERTVHFLMQICMALREAHSIGLIHRDIKPSNILACERGGVYDVAKLLDFGLVHKASWAGVDENLTMQGAVLGSPPFMSPEQASGKELDHRSDIYSLGCVAYFLLTGRPPFIRETVMLVMMAHVHEPVPELAAFRQDVPADLETVLRRCLEKIPENRFPDAASLCRALSRCPVANAWDDDRAANWWREHSRAANQVKVETSSTAVTRPITHVRQ